tara:strand:+ start:410 stop:598 length:189 start_codon:yes stop_codon:yes gene_type:complete
MEGSKRADADFSLLPLMPLQPPACTWMNYGWTPPNNAIIQDWVEVFNFNVTSDEVHKRGWGL